MEKKTKFWAFQISKTIIFEVEYYYCGGNDKPYFSTSASEFNRPKTDWKSCGQAQKELLPLCSWAKMFWRKWDNKHLHDLDDKEYKTLIQDIERLKNIYNHIELDQDIENSTYKRQYIPFYMLKDLSMLKMPNSKNKAIKFNI